MIAHVFPRCRTRFPCLFELSLYVGVGPAIWDACSWACRWGPGWVGGSAVFCLAQYLRQAPRSKFQESLVSSRFGNLARGSLLAGLGGLWVRGSVVGSVGCYSSSNSLMNQLSCMHNKAMHKVSALSPQGLSFMDVACLRHCLECMTRTEQSR